MPEYLKQDDVPAGTRGGPGRIVAAVAAIAALVLIGTTLAMALAPNDKLPGFLQGMAASLFPGNVGKGDVAQGTGGASSAEPTSGGAAGGASGTAIASAGTPTIGITTIGGPTYLTPTPTVPAPTPVALGSSAGTGGLRQPASALVPAAVGTAATAAATAPIPPVPGDITPPSPAMTATGTARPIGTATGPVAPAAVVPAKIEPVGTIRSAPTELLLRYDPAANGWTRLSGREQLMVGDRLLALPGYRPQLAMINGGITVDLLGGTLVELSPIDPMGTCGVRILRGRVIAGCSAAAKGKLAIDDGRLRGICTLGAAELGIEHVFHRQPGVDPAAAEVPWNLNLYAKSGDIVWAAVAGPPVPLPPTTTWTLSETTPPMQLAGAVQPSWLTQDERDPLERQAAEFIETNLRGTKAVTVVLKETLSDRRIENVQLALQCLAQLGDYEDFIPLLRDATQRYTTWERYLGSLTAALDYGPYYAGRVREAFGKQHGTAGDPLYRMLWSFDDAQLNAGAAKELVDGLDHPELDFRVIAYYTLVDITGLQLAYLPQDMPTKRKQAAQKWEQKLLMGQILHKKP